MVADVLKPAGGCRRWTPRVPSPMAVSSVPAWKWGSHLLVFFWLISFFNGEVNGECVLPAEDPLYNVKETAPQGTEIFTVAAIGDVSWRYEVENPNQQTIRDYISFLPSGDNYVMTVKKPMDLEELLNSPFAGDETAVTLKLICSQTGKTDIVKDVYIISNPVNEYFPTFNTSSINIYVPETTKPHATLIRLRDWASDRDRNPGTNEITWFSFLEPANPQLAIVGGDGNVSAKTALDYDALPDGQKYLEVGVKVTDSGGKTATATLTIHVTDADDLPPRFDYPGCPAPCGNVYYTSAVSANFTGALTEIEPASIQAVDADTLGSRIRYSLKQGPTADFGDFIQINADTAEVTIRKPLSELRLSEFVVILQAQELTTLRRATTTSLLIVLTDQPTLGGTVRASTNKDDDDLLIVGVVIGIIFFVIVVALLIGVVYYRTRYREAVHPHDDKQAGNKANTHDVTMRGKEGKTLQDPPRPITLCDGDMKEESEVTTWLPATHLEDIVDLSDEDTLKHKKRNGRAPSSTKMTSRDSAFEESSDKKSGSGDSQRDNDPDFDPMTEYAKIGDPSGPGDEPQTALPDHVYVPDPTLDPKSKDTGQTTDSGVEEAEYLTPTSTRAKLNHPAVAYNKSYRTFGADPDASIYSDIISIDGTGCPDGDVSGQEMPALVAAHVQTMENKGHDSNPTLKSLALGSSKTTLPDSTRSNSDAPEMTEYSTPRSARSSVLNDPQGDNATIAGSVTSQLPDIDERPNVPPRPKIKRLSGLTTGDSTTDDFAEDIQYASVQKKASRNPTRDISNTIVSNLNSSDHGEPLHKLSSRGSSSLRDKDSKEEVNNPIDPPMRRKRHRKRSKQVKAHEEDVYDGTKDYEDLEMDPEFYLDKNKTRVKRSSKIPAVQPDPDDTKYWISVTSDY